MRKNIALMAGGNSPEYVISLQSAAQIEQILDKTKYAPYPIYVKGHRWFYRDAEGRETDVDKNDFSLTLNGEKIALEYALLLIHGTPGEDGLLQAYFEMMDIPFSSSGFVASTVTFDKSLCKRALAPINVPMARDVLSVKGETVDPDAVIGRLGLPLFVKPNASGSSVGVTKVRSREELAAAVEKAFREGEQVLIEEFMEGTEVSQGVAVFGGKPYLFPPTEIVSKKEFFDYEAKYTPGMSEEITPARVSSEIRERLDELTLKIYRALGCRGLARVDYIVREGIPHMIEINTVPGMSGGSIVPKQAKAMGLGLTELFNLIIEDTLNR